MYNSKFLSCFVALLLSRMFNFSSFTLSTMSLWRTTRGKHIIGQNQGTSCPPLSSQANEALGDTEIPRSKAET